MRTEEPTAQITSHKNDFVSSDFQSFLKGERSNQLYREKKNQSGIQLVFAMESDLGCTAFLFRSENIFSFQYQRKQYQTS